MAPFPLYMSSRFPTSHILNLIKTPSFPLSDFQPEKARRGRCPLRGASDAVQEGEIPTPQAAFSRPRRGDHLPRRGLAANKGCSEYDSIPSTHRAHLVWQPQPLPCRKRARWSPSCSAPLPSWPPNGTGFSEPTSCRRFMVYPRSGLIKWCRTRPWFVVPWHVANSD